MDNQPIEHELVPAPIEPTVPERPSRAAAIRTFFDAATLRIIAISAATIIVILVIVMAVVWANRGTLFKYFATDYARSVAAASEGATPGAKLAAAATGADAALPSVFSDQSLVENAVSAANPAVVAITISKVVPQYSTTYQTQPNPFQDFFGNGFNPFGNMNLQVPVQTPNGSQEQEVGAGSGFLITSDGMIVTNRHVVDDTSAKYTVHLSNGKSYDATVLARDAVLDVAIVKIQGVGFPHLSLGNSDALRLGQSVIAIGNALGQFQNSVSVGVVSGLSRSITAGDESGSSESLDHVIQTDAAINPGNSGGPLLDLSGNVVGVNTAIVQGSENIGFAIPVNTLKTVINSVERTGKIIRPYIGIRYQPIDADYQKQNNLSVDYGVIILPGEKKGELAVIPGSPADKAGLVENDIILSVDGQKLDQDHDLASIIRQKNVGDSVQLTVLSKGIQKTVTVTLSAAPQE